MEYGNFVPHTCRANRIPANDASPLPVALHFGLLPQPVGLLRRLYFGSCSEATFPPITVPIDRCKQGSTTHVCKQHVDRSGMFFSGMYNTVHLDEKIFYITQPRRRFLLLPDEPAPTRCVKSRRFVTHVMMLAAVSRPRYDSDEAFFDGKLGIWVFTEQVVAVRSSAHRPAGTLETKEVSVAKSTYREKLVSKVLPARK
ncbi:hypothetical protein PI126_g15867 [Phytophthora idaei]|nr:hypothetical protein PI126_g15867 [Phytophthora idaei]